ncbi:LysE/ArgO family amino acid transporter [Kordiimonas pumila]|uniref:LysE/ArgO family amino acid transporter n=1 Tax=Kordiimonas pumila TaxID=2161677 RepID=A0ABV7D822_9PROT|nr:LysE/ArgO family amino acid transporter [Kordiimonas pumila]
MVTAALEGFLLSIGLIMAIGPQNAYVLRQGLRHQHVGAVSTTCFLSDALLIALGVLGVGQVIADNSLLKMALGWGGVGFLLWFACKSAMSAIKPEALTSEDMEKSAEGIKGRGVSVAVMHALAFTFLNPWVYIDTMVLVGGVSVKYATEATRLMFLLGACTASGVWFYLLGYGAKKAAPMFKKPITWRILDSVITVIMLLVAVMLISTLISG